MGKSGANFFRLATVLILITPLYELFTRLFLGFKCFGKVLKGLVLENVINLFFAFVFVAVLGFGIFGVLYAKAISVLFFIAFALFYFRKLEFKKSFPDLKDVKKYAKGFVSWNIFHRLRVQTELVLMGLFVFNWELGLYYLANKIATYLLEAPSNALVMVLLPYNIERYKDSGTMARFASLSIKFSIILTLSMGVLLLIFGETILEVLFPEFLEGFYLFPFFILLFALNLSSPIATIFKALNRADLLAKSQFVALLVQVFVGFFLISSLRVVGIVLTRAIVFLVHLLVMLYFLHGLKIRVEIIPRFRDLKFFYSSLKSLLPFWH